MSGVQATMADQPRCALGSVSIQGRQHDRDRGACVLVQFIQSGHVLRYGDAHALRQVDTRTRNVQSQTPCSSFGSNSSARICQTYRARSLPTTSCSRASALPYTFNPDTVVRASYGKYIEQPSAAYEQYDSQSQNLPDQLVPFYSLGFTRRRATKFGPPFRTTPTFRTSVTSRARTCRSR